MADQTNRGGRDREGYGDDQGTRVGRPDAPARRDEEFRGTDADEFRAPTTEPRKKSPDADEDEDDAGRGRGSTASGGSSAHDAAHSETGAGSEAAEGTVPVRERTYEHKGDYGGEGGAPRK